MSRNRLFQKIRLYSNGNEFHSALNLFSYSSNFDSLGYKFILFPEFDTFRMRNKTDENKSIFLKRNYFTKLKCC